MQIDAKSPEGNAFSVMNAVKEFFRETDQMSEWAAASREMMAGNYDHLCDVAFKLTDGAVEVIGRD